MMTLHPTAKIFYPNSVRCFNNRHFIQWCKRIHYYSHTNTTTSADCAGGGNSRTLSRGSSKNVNENVLISGETETRQPLTLTSLGHCNYSAGLVKSLNRERDAERQNPYYTLQHGGHSARWSMRSCFVSHCSLIQPQSFHNFTFTPKRWIHQNWTRLFSSDVELTRLHYPSVKRGSFSRLTRGDVDFFDKLLDGRIVTDQDELIGFNTDWLKSVRGESKIVLKPRTTAEVSGIIKYCNERHLAVVPQGGNTGMVGGSNPVFDEIILSTQLMNKIIGLDDVAGVLTCQSGCVLQTLDQHIEDYGLTMPLDLGAKGSCHIGGNVATNAGGIHVLRYGSLHAAVLGLEVVLPNGDIVNTLTTMRKDNTGYDLKQLFIGSEGTLGVITAVSILCPQSPKATNVALLGCEDFSRVLDIFKSCKSHLAEILSAFEFMDNQTMSVVGENLNLSSPLSSDFPFYVLVECSGSNGDHDQEKLMELLQSVLDSGLALDGTLATDSTKIKNIWDLRERCTEALLMDGYCYKYDVSLPMASYYRLAQDMRERTKNHVIRTVAFGHVGDGNLHLNFTTRQFDPATMDLIEPFIYDWVSEHGGSVSAEHGLGFKKRDFIYHSKSKQAVAMMATLKKAIDPKGIMNPYKVLPSF